MGKKIHPIKKAVAKEKGTFLTLALLLVSAGVMAMVGALDDPLANWQIFIGAIVVIAVGVVMIYLREYLDVNRWGEMRARATAEEDLAAMVEETPG